MKKTQQSTACVTDLILAVTMVAVGGFHEYIACALSAVLSVVLLVRLEKSRTLRFRKSPVMLGVFLLCAGYGLTCLWAIDRGMALIGFFKFLPAALYLLCLWQEEGECRILQLLPWVGAAMTAASVVLFFSPLKGAVSVNGRLAGFLQYPNTYAVFCLICQLLLLKKPEKVFRDYLLMLILAAGVLLSGSRTVFVLFVLSNAAMVLLTCSKKLRLILLGILGAGLGAVLLLAAANTQVLERYLTISLTESTFVGRLLYMLDALPLLAKYPFGMGYLGYSYVQQSIQTGVYTVTFIHNDFLQFLLDVGWIPGGLFLAAVAGWFFRKDVPVADKIIAGVLCLHSLLDFNLQYTGMFLLLLLLMGQGKANRTWEIKGLLWLKAGCTAVLMASLYLSVAVGLGHWGMCELSDFLYPFNTRNKLTMLSNAEDLYTANRLADQILAQNTHHYAAYSAKAKYACAQGDFSALIQYKNEVFRRNPFDHTEYDEYCRILIQGIEIYRRSGDMESVRICQNELLRAAQMLADNENRLSVLGRCIDDQPVTLLAGDIQYFISQMEDVP